MKHTEVKISGNSDMETELKNQNCPFPPALIPNHIGINLCAVSSIAWTQQDDGQLVNLVINFIPEPKERC